MTVTPAPIDGVFVIDPRRFDDERGYFLETFHDERYLDHGVADVFVQDNHSRSVARVLRGLHFRRRHPQAQLVTVIRGRIFDVVVDLRAASPTFGGWFGVELSDTGPRQLYMTAGLAHGFCVLSEWADVHYKASRRYDPADAAGVRWDDPDIGIAWPLASPIVTRRDAEYPRLRDLPPDALPHL
jgi:dTDP-4-dehydrorhamnose 3,5-epimerase